jgi:hypothetical protein
VVLLALVAVCSLAIGGMLGWKVLARTDPPPVLHTMIPPPESTEYDLKGAAPGPGDHLTRRPMIAFVSPER